MVNMKQRWSYHAAEVKERCNFKVCNQYARAVQGQCATSMQRMHVKFQCKGASLTVVGGGLLLFGQQQVRLSASQRVIHWVCVVGLEVCQALDVDAVGDDTNEHGRQYGHVIQHPGLTTSALCKHRGVHQLGGAMPLAGMFLGSC